MTEKEIQTVVKMAMLGTKLMGGLMSHSEAEKMFRPWWDAIEDFVIYGLIMLMMTAFILKGS